MLTCSHCGLEKANSQMFRLGETDDPICKACQSHRLPDAEFEAMRVCTNAIERLQPDAKLRAILYLRNRFLVEAT